MASYKFRTFCFKMMRIVVRNKMKYKLNKNIKSRRIKFYQLPTPLSIIDKKKKKSKFLMIPNPFVRSQ